jgi:hypothetical protein
MAHLKRFFQRKICKVRFYTSKSVSALIGDATGQLNLPISDARLVFDQALHRIWSRYVTVASRLEQLNAPARAYHQEMKRDLPVTCCTDCGGAGYNIRVVNGRCCRIIGKQRCNGVNASALKNTDWIECAHCEATGYYRNKECPKCKGTGYIFAGLKDKETVV